jgi:zinc metalloprotease ZmpB
MLESAYSAILDLKSPNILFIRESEGRLIQLDHIREPVGLGRQSSNPPPIEDLKELAVKYLNLVKGGLGYNIADYPVNLDVPSLPNDPNSEQTVLRLADVKSLDNNIVFTIAQTFGRVEVWQAGISLSMNYVSFNGKLVITGSRSTLHNHVSVEEDLGSALVVPNSDFTPNRLEYTALADALNISSESIAEIKRKRFLIYKYLASDRIDPTLDFSKPPLSDYTPSELFPLTDVPAEIKENRHTLVTDVLFTTIKDKLVSRDDTLPSILKYRLTWQVFLDVKTGAVLYLRAFAAGCLDDTFPLPDPPTGVGARGRVMRQDPMAVNGIDPFTLRPDEIEAALQALSTHTHLPAIIDNPGPRQFLSGEYVQINTEDTAPIDPNPSADKTTSNPSDFTQDILPHPVNYTAVNAYYHCTMVFSLMERLGFHDLAHNYFHNMRVFPILVDPQGTDGELNAMVLGDGSNGIEEMLFGPMQPGQSQLGMGIGNASDVRVVLHEFCHILLYSHLNSANFGFAHSAGDSLAAILCDPDSFLRADPILRFQTFPWIAAANPQAANPRFHGGTVDGRGDMQLWGWRGQHFFADTTGYLREQILSMTLFHLYCALGGDSAEESKRCLAALYVTYLVIGAIALHDNNANLSTEDPGSLAIAMTTLDGRKGALQGEPFAEIRGGGVSKVIRWVFEKHGYKYDTPAPNIPPAPGEKVPNAGEGAPPRVDVYINDRDSNGALRCGEYAPMDDFSTTEIWNRTQSIPGSGPTDHEKPKATAGNFIYARVRNRGYRTAEDVSVRAYFASAVNGLEPLWDGDVTNGGSWTEMVGDPLATIGLTVHRGDECIVGPFAWCLGEDSAGTEFYVLVSVSAPSDLTNLSPNSVAPSFGDEPIPLWWLVPFDNNLGLRKLVVAP